MIMTSLCTISCCYNRIPRMHKSRMTFAWLSYAGNLAFLCQIYSYILLSTWIVYIFQGLYDLIASWSSIDHSADYSFSVLFQIMKLSLLFVSFHLICIFCALRLPTGTKHMVFFLDGGVFMSNLHTRIRWDTF